MSLVRVYLTVSFTVTQVDESLSNMELTNLQKNPVKVVFLCFSDTQWSEWKY